MEQIQSPLTAFTLRSGSVRVSHLESGLGRGLDLGEQLVVCDPSSGLHVTATVADVDFELEDTTYRLALGREITAGEAAEWLTAGESNQVPRLSTRDVTALLDILRAGRLDVAEALAD